jgi:hypothetical protein
MCLIANCNGLKLIWNKSNTSKLEKIQARALRFIYEDYESTYDELLEKAKVPSLKVRRMRTMAICSHPRYIYNIGISKIIFTIFKNN